jgi:cysteine-rich repeat protein
VCELDISADTCGSAPTVASGTYLGSTAVASGKLNDYGPYTCSVSGSGGGAGIDAVYAVDVPAGSILNASVVGTGFDAVLATSTSCPGINASCLIRRDATGLGGTESLSYTNATVSTQRIYVVVDAFSANTGGAFALTINVVTPVCGNGVVEPGEQCDDGGTMAGNGCGATCQVELGYTCTGAPSVCSTVLPGCMDQFVVVPATGLPVAIPDNQPNGGAILTFNVANTGTVTGLAMGFSATHTWVDDLDIYLTGPDAVQRNVCLDRGSSGDNFTGTVFRDGGAPLANAVAPFAGVYAPEQAFSYFNTQTVTGTWTIRVADDATGDVGTVTQAYLAFCIAP